LCPALPEEPHPDVLFYLPDSGAGVPDIGLLVCAAVPGRCWDTGRRRFGRRGVVGAHRRIPAGVGDHGDGAEEVRKEKLTAEATEVRGVRANCGGGWSQRFALSRNCATIPPLRASERRWLSGRDDNPGVGDNHEVMVEVG